MYFRIFDLNKTTTYYLVDFVFIWFYVFLMTKIFDLYRGRQKILNWKTIWEWVLDSRLDSGNLKLKTEKLWTGQGTRQGAGLEVGHVELEIKTKKARDVIEVFCFFVILDRFYVVLCFFNQFMWFSFVFDSFYFHFFNHFFIRSFLCG